MDETHSKRKQIEELALSYVKSQKSSMKILKHQAMKETLGAEYEPNTKMSYENYILYG